ncbi:MAG: SEC59/DGK1/VTE5 family protein [Nanoarchaeota archaeon]|nr:SEC59/DGK1/VTE5 family protein [Nanoarchaeota archaeon]
MLSDLEIRRNLFHLVTGVILSLMLFKQVFPPWLWTVCFAIAMVLSVLARYEELPLLSWMLRQYEREKDIKRFPGRGAVLMLGMATALSWAFPDSISAAAMMILAIGDSVSPLIGQYGSMKHPLNHLKHIEGTFAGIAAATVSCLWFVPWWHALIAATVAMTVETLEIELNKHILDDNITIPLIAGIILWILTYI